MTVSPLQRIQKASQEEDVEERARKAVKAFRSLQPTLTAYAKMITGKSDVQIVVSPTDNGGTDGKRIFIRPPLELGDKTPHERSFCSKRDPNTHRMLCPACAIRESVLRIIYHEIGHIAGQSFRVVSPVEKARAIAWATNEARSEYGERVRQRMDAHSYKNYMELAQHINGYLPFLLNCMEDVRVDAKMFKARPGLKIMFEVDTKEVFEEGFENRNADGSISIIKWNESPLNNQVMIGVFCKASGYDYSQWFHPDVVEALDDPALTRLTDQVADLDSVEEVFRLSFHILARLRELGFLATPEDPDPQPDPDESGDTGESDDSSDSEDEGSSDQDSGASSGDPGDGGSSGSDSEPAESEDSAESGAGDSPSSSGSGDESEDSDADDANGSEDDSQEGEADYDESGSESQGEGDPSEGASAEDGEPDESDSGDGTSTDDSSVGEEESQASGDLDGDESDDGLSPEGSGDSHGERPEGESEADSPESDEDAGDGSSEQSDGSEHDSQLVGSSGETDNDSHAEGNDTDSPDTGDKDEIEDSEGSSNSDGSGDDGEDNRAEDEGDEELLDTGADDGYGGTEVDENRRPEMGTPDDLVDVIEMFGDHDEKPSEIEPGSFEEKAIEKAVVQGIYFTKPSDDIFGVREHNFGQQTVEKNINYTVAWDMANAKFSTGHKADLIVPKQILDPVILAMRRTFSDNQRGARQNNLKSGKIHNRTLGKRAWNNDPRLFTKKRLPGKRSYEVVIGLDISGSTIGKNIAIEKRAAWALAEMLDRVGIPFSMYAHTGNMKDGHKYSEDHQLALEVYNVKKPHEVWGEETQKALDYLGGYGANIDGHFLEFLRKRADESRATDKIILYFSDGKMPVTNYNEELEILQHEIQYCKSNRYTLLGVGIRTDSPRAHGLPTVQLNGDEDLSKVVHHLGDRLAETQNR